MISFKKFLEHSSIDPRKAVEDFQDKVGEPLYRGIKSDVESAIFPHPKDRSATHSEDHFVFMFNSMIDAAFKVSNVRTHSLFCIGSDRDSILSNYGNIYSIAPLGDYKFIWSEKIFDSYSVDYRIWNRLENILQIKCKVNIPIENFFIKFTQMMQDRSLLDSSWVHSIDKFRTVISFAFTEAFDDTYNDRFDHKAYFADFLVESLREAGLELYKNSNIKAAIESQNEILIYESDGYAAVLHRTKPTPTEVEDDNDPPF